MEKVTRVRSNRIISRPLEIVLRVFGIWPGDSYNLFFKLFWLSVNIIFAVPQYIFVVKRIHILDLPIFMYAVAITMAFTAKIIKLVIFWLQQRRFDDIWRTVSTDWQLNHDGKTHLSHHIPNIIVAFNTLSIIVTSYGNVMAGIHYDEASNLTRPFVLMMELPFECKTQFVYLLVVFVQFFYAVLFCAGAATINSVLVILTLHLGDQIDIVRRSLLEMPAAEKEHGTNVIMTKEIIRKHQKVIAFSENIESLYTYIALMLFVLNIMVSCSLGFVLATAIRMPNSSKIIMKNIMFYCVINIENLTYCFAGEYISSKSKKIGEAAYNSPWYQSKSHSRLILFLVMRSQNPLAITVGKFMELSLDRFASIIKISASYVSVLLAMY